MCFQPPDFSTIAESDDVNSTGKKPKSINNIDGQKLEVSKGWQISLINVEIY